MTVASIVLAGGSGSRIQTPDGIGQAVNKVYLPIGDRAMLAYSLEVFTSTPDVDRIVVVAREGDADDVARLGDDSDSPIDVIVGGETRHRSERNGIEHLAADIESGAVDLVSVHDGARPFLTAPLLATLIETARRVGGAVPALPVSEILYGLSDEGSRLIDTEGLRRVQTPQVFRAPELLGAYRAAAAEAFEGVDTAETVARFGRVEIASVVGDERNIKVTFVEDLLRAEELARLWAPTGWR